MLRFDNKGLNFMLIDVGFQKGVSGVYHGLFNLDAFGTKADASNLLKFKMKEDGVTFNIMEDPKPKIEVNSPFWQISQMIVCEDLKYNGFGVCK